MPLSYILEVIMSRDLEIEVRHFFKQLREDLSVVVEQPLRKERAYQIMQRFFRMTGRIIEACNNSVIGRVYPFTEDTITTPEQRVFIFFVKEFHDSMRSFEASGLYDKTKGLAKLQAIKTAISTNDFGCYGATMVLKTVSCEFLSELA